MSDYEWEKREFWQQIEFAWHMFCQTRKADDPDSTQWFDLLTELRIEYNDRFPNGDENP